MVARTERDPYADFLRAFALLVVVLYHWWFTILVWDGGVTAATNPLAFTPGLWILTWVLQVVPLFFYIGSYVHLRSWEAASARGERLWSFALRQARSLAIPSALLVVGWTAVGLILATAFDLQWAVFAIFLVLSPMWFVLAYLFFVCMMPVTVWLHRRFDVLVLVVLAGLAVIVDLLRLRFDVPVVEWTNMLFVWGFAFQLGYFHRRITGLDTAPPRPDGGTDWAHQTPRARIRAWSLTLGGLVVLVGLVFSGVYPGAMVGVPDQYSNMAPPTICLIALTVFQVGLAELARPWVMRGLSRGGLTAKVTGVFSRFALPLFLFHTTGMALALAVDWAIFGPDPVPTELTPLWWLTRPFASIPSLLATLLIIALFARRFEQPRASASAGGVPAGGAAPVGDAAGLPSGGGGGPVAEPPGPGPAPIPPAATPLIGAAPASPGATPLIGAAPPPSDRAPTRAGSLLHRRPRTPRR